MRSASLMLVAFLLAPGAARAEGASPAGEEEDLLPAPGERFERGNAEPLPATPWWEGLGQEALTEVIVLGLRRSHDVAAAASRVEAAEARAERAAAPFYPTITIDATFGGQPSSSLGFQFGGLIGGGAGGAPGGESPAAELPAVIYNGSAQLTLRYQPDLFGMQRRTWRAAQRAIAAAEGDADAAAARQQIAIIERQIELNRSLLEVLELRYENDAATAAEVLQQRQQLASTRARLPRARALARMARERLALLLGMEIQEAARRLPELPPELPELSGEPATGRPRDLMSNRPELRAARERLQAAQERVRAAWLQAMPTLSVQANAGGQIFAGDDVRATETWGFGINVSVPIFRGLVERAAIREARAEVTSARHSLQQSLLQAISEVEGALASEREQREILEAQREVLEVARLSYQVSRDSYVEGVGPYLGVLTALATLQGAELNVLQAHRDLLSARLRLYLALGGGWTRGLAPSGDGGE